MIATPKVLFIATGGTISTVRDPVSHELLRRASGEELLQSIPGLSGICDVEVIQYDNAPSMDITPSRVLEIALVIREAMKRDEITGVVVTIGTDTLEEAAYLLDVLVAPGKPVVVTGAMRGGGLLGADGARNLQASLLTACDKGSSGLGTLVVLNDQIHAACGVTKAHSLNPGTFQSPGTGPLGEVWGNRVVYHFGAPNWRRYVETLTLEENVDLIKVVLSMDARYVRASIEAGAKGIAVEAAATGAMPGSVRDALVEAAASGVAIGLTSRCFAGGPAGFMGRMPQGVFTFPGLSGPKVRLLLMAVLGASQGDSTMLARFLG